MAITIRVNLAVIAAAVIGELVSTAWQSDALPWGRYEDHYLITSLVADFILAVILEWITRYVRQPQGQSPPPQKTCLAPGLCHTHRPTLLKLFNSFHFQS